MVTRLDEKEICIDSFLSIRLLWYYIILEVKGHIYENQWAVQWKFSITCIYCSLSGFSQNCCTMHVHVTHVSMPTDQYWSPYLYLHITMYGNRLFRKESLALYGDGSSLQEKGLTTCSTLKCHTVGVSKLRYESVCQNCWMFLQAHTGKRESTNG